MWRQCVHDVFLSFAVTGASDKPRFEVSHQVENQQQSDKQHLLAVGRRYMHSDVTTSDFEHSRISSRHDVTSSDAESVYKATLLERLRDVLQVQSLDEVISASDVTAFHVMHNMTHVNSSGVVAAVDDTGERSNDDLELYVREDVHMQALVSSLLGIVVEQSL